MDNLVAENILKNNGYFELKIDRLEIQKNKTNIVLGENGAGKSTLLNYIVEDVNIFGGIKKALLTQSSYTFSKTCVKNVEMVLKWNKSERDPLEFLELVDLLDKKDHKGNELSGGQRKRLAFAMALATEAELLLLDEPFANLDYENQRKLIEIIKNLKGKITIIIVSHRKDICQEIGDYFIYMRSGVIHKAENELK